MLPGPETPNRADYSRARKAWKANSSHSVQATSCIMPTAGHDVPSTMSVIDFKQNMGVWNREATHATAAASISLTATLLLSMKAMSCSVKSRLLPEDTMPA